MRAIALRYSRELGLDADEVALLEQIYPDRSAFLELMAADSATFQRAQHELGLPTTGSDPIAAAALRFDAPLALRFDAPLALRFDAPLALRHAAAELGMPAEVLASEWPARRAVALAARATRCTATPSPRSMSRACVCSRRRSRIGRSRQRVSERSRPCSVVELIS